MAKRLGKFELPKRLVRAEETATPTFACFVAEPFEKGFGHTIGNALRRILLSAIEGGAIASVKIEGLLHEFQCCEGVLEDGTEIVLNLKKVHLQLSSHEPVTLHIDVDKKGAVTAGDIRVPPGVKIVNPDQLICTLTEKRHFRAELKALLGRGYRLAEYNKEPEQSAGVIAIDSLFSPVTLVSYRVEDARVGQTTDFDKLILEISTDGRVTPEEALKDAVTILRHHLDVFGCIDSDVVKVDDASSCDTERDENRLRKLFGMSVNDIELSVRAINCLNTAGILTVGELASKSEAEMLKYRNFGKKSLLEMKECLASLGLSFGMKIDENLKH